MSLGQGERSPDRDSYFPKNINYFVFKCDILVIFFYRSNGQSQIYFDKEKNKWKLVSHTPPFLHLLMDRSGLNVVPVGRNTWKIMSGDGELCGKSDNSSISLTLSSCFPNKFTCDNGDCIQLR